MILFCNNKKCKMKKNCIRYTYENKPKIITTNFKQICNYENRYRWIYLDPKCTNKKYIKIYQERKKKIS